MQLTQRGTVVPAEVGRTEEELGLCVVAVAYVCSAGDCVAAQLATRVARGRVLV